MAKTEIRKKTAYHHGDLRGQLLAAARGAYRRAWAGRLFPWPMPPVLPA
ncbi:hypothetical protein QW131_27765 [Roseibium salinum]|nr:hypothetical protein [Roseibium salinum]